MKRLPWLLIALVAALAAAIVTSRLTPSEHITTFPSTPQPADVPGMCPWRTPQADMRAFFPGANRYEQRILILSDLRSEIIGRLGPQSPMDANGIYYYRVYNATKQVGSALVQRTPGEYGVVEYVIGVLPNGRISGVRIQRQREPKETVAAIDSSAWLGAFTGKTSEAAFQLGDDIPAVPQSAATTAGSLAQSIRRLMIEYDVAHKRGR